MKLNFEKSPLENLFDLIKDSNPNLQDTFEDFRVEYDAPAEYPNESNEYVSFIALGTGSYPADDSVIVNYTKQDVTPLIFGADELVLEPGMDKAGVVSAFMDLVDDAAAHEYLEVEANHNIEENQWVVTLSVNEEWFRYVRYAGAQFTIPVNTVAEGPMGGDVVNRDLNGFYEE